MIALRLESVRELWVVLTFHVVGTVMEVFKTAAGSWRYEVDGLAHIGGVPLYTGFMYAAVGSYMVRVMRLFDLRFTHYPPRWATALLAVAIYANFFTHHYFPDARWVLLAAVLLLHGRCTMRLRSHRRAPWRRMPVVLSFVGVASLLWIAENLGTGVGAWIYPQQADGWHLVPLSKLVSWLLLMQVSVVPVTLVRPPRGRGAPRGGWPEPGHTSPSERPARRCSSPRPRTGPAPISRGPSAWPPRRTGSPRRAPSPSSSAAATPSTPP